MQNCVGCLQIVSADCVKSEEKFSFDHESINDVLHNLDKNINTLTQILTKKIDNKGVTGSYQYVTDYLQDIINRLDSIKPVQEITPVFKIQSEITGNGAERSLLQILTSIVKELEAVKKKINTGSSLLYTPNV